MENLTNINVIRELFEKHGFSFSKALGQNFLVNPSVCPKIAELGRADKDHGVIEIGTGVGVLTNEHAKRAKKVVAIEIDDRLMPILGETLAEYDNVKIINADVMKIDLKRLIEDEFQGMKISVCANLPYYITSPIIMMLLEQRLPIDCVTVMVQKEAGTRLCAKIPSREMGAVTVAVNYFSQPKVLFNVSRGSFMPSPNVDSCVVQFDLHYEDKYAAADEAFFFKTVRAAFSQRRKTLVNSLSFGLPMDKSKVNDAIGEAGLPLTVRPEQLTIDELISVSETLKNRM